MEVLRLGVKLELYLPAHTTATAMQDQSHIWDLQHSSWQRWILNPLDKLKAQTCVLMDVGQRTLSYDGNTFFLSFFLFFFFFWERERENMNMNAYQGKKSKNENLTGYKPGFQGVPIVAQQNQIQLVSMRIRVLSLALLTGWGIQCCRELWCMSKIWLRSCVAE